MTSSYTPGPAGADSTPTPEAAALLAADGPEQPVERGGFSGWRRRRPFWGGLLIIVAGAAILLMPLSIPPALFVQAGIAGIAGWVVGVVLITVGLLVWLQPMLRFFYGVVAIMLALASFITSTFGGLGMGLVTGIVGGALTVAWVPRKTRRIPVRRRRATAISASDPGPQPQDYSSISLTDRATAMLEGERAREVAPGEPEPGEVASEPTLVDQPAVAEPTVDQPTVAEPTVDEPQPPTRGWLARRFSGRSSRDDRALSIVAPVAAVALLVPLQFPAAWPFDLLTPSPAPQKKEEPKKTSTPSARPTSPTWKDIPGLPPGTRVPEGIRKPVEDLADKAREGSEGLADKADELDREGKEYNKQPCQYLGARAGKGWNEKTLKSVVEACADLQKKGVLKLPKAPDVEWPPSRNVDGFPSNTEGMSLSAQRLVLKGARVGGVVNYPTKKGRIKLIRIEADRATFYQAGQYINAGGKSGRVQYKFPTLDFDGHVVLHVSSMQADLLGIRLTFTTDFPPPLLLPNMEVENVVSEDAIAQADVVRIPGLWLQGQNGRKPD